MSDDYRHLGGFKANLTRLLNKANSALELGITEKYEELGEIIEIAFERYGDAVKSALAYVGTGENQKLNIREDFAQKAILVRGCSTIT